MLAYNENWYVLILCICLNNYCAVWLPAATSFVFEGAYNGYMNWMQSLFSRIPYHVVVGNHEVECHDPACVLRYENNLYQL